MIIVTKIHAKDVLHPGRTWNENENENRGKMYLEERYYCSEIEDPELRMDMFSYFTQSIELVSIIHHNHLPYNYNYQLSTITTRIQCRVGGRKENNQEIGRINRYSRELSLNLVRG